MVIIINMSLKRANIFWHHFHLALFAEKYNKTAVSISRAVVIVFGCFFFRQVLNSTSSKVLRTKITFANN